MNLKYTVSKYLARITSTIGKTHIICNHFPANLHLMQSYIVNFSSNICQAMAGNNNYRRNERLMETLSSQFSRSINPLNILHLFHRYSDKVLTQIEIGAIKAHTDAKGPTHGAILLFNCLYKYEGWFQCLLAVLRDRDVRLQHLADEMEQMQADLIEQESQTSMSD